MTDKARDMKSRVKLSVNKPAHGGNYVLGMYWIDLPTEVEGAGEVFSLTSRSSFRISGTDVLSSDEYQELEQGLRSWAKEKGIVVEGL